MNNPPAFPQQCADALDVGMVHEGMTLRDWFAGQALSGWLADPYVGDDPKTAAERVYQFADAMLAERARGESA